jgi:hypothetical protein
MSGARLRAGGNMCFVFCVLRNTKRWGFTATPAIPWPLLTFLIGGDYFFPL